MPPSKRKRRARDKKHRHIVLILLFVIIATLFFYSEFPKEIFQPKIREPEEAPPEEIRITLPRVAIVIDDLGPSKNRALKIFDINSSLTLSILPSETYTKWIAGEGYTRGYDILAHIPMEAKEPHKLGSGGLYTWMTDDEIRETLAEDFNSIPHIKAMSNHMGSALTEDKRAMDVVMSVAKEHGLFFLDSLTTPNSTGARLAKKHRVMFLKRDIYLDVKDSPADIAASWQKLVRIAKKKGHAIALAHPRKNTIEFLKQALPSDEVMVVPLSTLVPSQ